MAEVGQQPQLLTKLEIKKRYEAAVLYSRGSTFKDKLVKYFYRDNPEKYFKKVYDTPTGEMVLRYKDNNGSQDNPINGKLKGLFFSAQTPALRYSYFGDRRLNVKANPMLTQKAHNIYFSDFYCMENCKAHYVTVVVTEPDSENAIFCDANLVPLNINDNPVMWIQDGSIWAMQCPIVEIFWTEQMFIRTICPDIKQLEAVETRGNGQATLEGIPKDLNCTICNV